VVSHAGVRCPRASAGRRAAQARSSTESLHQTRGRAFRSARALRLVMLIALAVLAPALCGMAEKVSAIGEDQRVLVICVRFKGTTATRNSPDDWVTLLNEQVSPFYEQATYRQTTFVFETAPPPNNVWYDLDISVEDVDNGTKKTEDYMQEAISEIDPYVDFSDYNRVLIITNNQRFCGKTTAQRMWVVGSRAETGNDRQSEVIDGQTVWKRYMTVTALCENTSGGNSPPFDDTCEVAAHELGHQLGVRTHYADRWWRPDAKKYIITPWDVMGWSNALGNTVPRMNHFLGWAKDDMEWIEPSQIATVGPPTSRGIDITITLRPLAENPDKRPGGTQIIKIPFSSSGTGDFYGYYVENRRRVFGDTHIPEEGVIVTLVDENQDTALRCVVLEPNGLEKLGQAALAVGESYYDASRGLEISVTGLTGDDCDVRVEYPLPSSLTADPMITPWGAPGWESPDIWIDSSKNTWGVYSYTNESGDPIGNGDPAWVGKTNRIYVRVHNPGTAPAVNVTVNVYTTEPPGMGDRGADWEWRGVIWFPEIPASGSDVKFVTWNPTRDKHTCIKAVISDQSDELNTSNNLAFENVTHFESSSSSPYKPVALTMHVYNPFDERELPILFVSEGVPDGWGIELDPPRLTLPPGGHGELTARVYPVGPTWSSCKAIAPCAQEAVIGKPSITAFAPYADFWIPLGGVEMWVHLVEDATLTLEADVDGFDATLRGQLTPAVAGAVIAIEIKDDEGGAHDVVFATTGSDGRFRTEFSMPESGVFVAQAFWSGNETLGETASPPRLFRAKGVPVM